MSFRIGAFLVFLGFAAPSAAYWTAQDMTEVEWRAWPKYCQAGYLISQWGETSPFRGRLTRDEINNTLRTVSIDGTHHFCIALVAMNRAIGKSAAASKELMKTAVSEINYSRSRMGPSNPQFSFVSAYYAKALYGSGERSKAFEVWDEAINRTPTERESYLLKAEALISEKRLNESLEVVLAYDAKKKEPRADAEYFIGYVYFQLGKYPEARLRLDNAHQLGYPNDGLRNRLTKMGY